MKQVLMHQGAVVVEEVPPPTAESGMTIVNVSHSCISTGTELSGMKHAAMPLWKRALKNPDKVRKALTMLATKGYAKTKSIIQGKLTAANATGYSASGTTESGARVACAGAQYAHHAQVIQVPKNLVVSIPDELGFPEASTVALGAIALQGVRRANPTLGETFVVIGLGFLGQVTGQILKANGCRVFGMDLDQGRVALGETFGIETALPKEVDGVIITAATPSSEVISTAFKLCRKKGRVVLVGDVGLNLKRADFYQKELDFFISTSYGPGRYDDRYEEKGLDYPIGYVRWTEERNMAEYLKLLANKKVNISPLISSIFPIEEAAQAYEFLNKTEPRPLLALLSYQNEENLPRTIPNPQANISSKGQIKLAVVGAGGFAKEMHLPNLQSIPSFHLQAIVSRSGHNAKETAKQFGASYATTDFKEVLKSPEVDAVLIATRHHLHASMTLEALRAGKHVLIEKPLSLKQEELDEIIQFYKQTPDAPILLTGFNRRFSKYAQAIHKVVKKRTQPMMITYRMNAGYLPPEHWVHGGEGGGRNIGEACHIYDLFTFLTGSEIAHIGASGMSNENFVATLTFKDGSIATLTYTALGSSEHPKEQMEVFIGGKVLAMNDYRQFGDIQSKIPEKGQKEELAAFAQAIQEGGEWPIPLWQQIQAMEIAFKVEEIVCAD